MPLKSYEDILVAFNQMLSNGLEIYLQKFVAPFMGDWPTQFFMRQLVYNVAEVSLPAICQNVVPLIGPLHIHTYIHTYIIQLTPHWGFSVADYIKCYAYF